MIQAKFDLFKPLEVPIVWMNKIPFTFDVSCEASAKEKKAIFQKLSDRLLVDGDPNKQRREKFNLNIGEWIGLIDKGFDQKKYSWVSPFAYLNRNTDVQSLAKFFDSKA